MKNKIIIPTSLGITAVALLVAFVSFDMVDTNDDTILTTETELERVNVSQKLLPPESPLFLSHLVPIVSPGSGDLDFDWSLDDSEYHHLVNVLPKYDYILVYEIYAEYEYSFTDEDELNFKELLGTSVIYDDELGDFKFADPISDEDALKEMESLKNSLKEKDGKVLADYTKIFLSQDPLDGTEYPSEYTNTLEGIIITITPKGDYTTETILESQSGDQIIHEVSNRIIGELTPMRYVILVDDYDERPYTYPAIFRYIDDESVVRITGAITTEQVSALAMAISEDKKQ